MNRLQLWECDTEPSHCARSTSNTNQVGGNASVATSQLLRTLWHGPYSSVVERQSCKLKVLGSIPSEGFMRCQRALYVCGCSQICWCYEVHVRVTSVCLPGACLLSFKYLSWLINEMIEVVYYGRNVGLFCVVDVV